MISVQSSLGSVSCLPNFIPTSLSRAEYWNMDVVADKALVFAKYILKICTENLESKVLKLVNGNFRKLIYEWCKHIDLVVSLTLCYVCTCCCYTQLLITEINPLNPELNPICCLLALLGAYHFLHVSRIRVKLLTFRRLMSSIYGAPILDVSRSHTTTQHIR